MKVFYFNSWYNFGDQLVPYLFKHFQIQIENNPPPWADVISIGSLLGYYLGNEIINYRPLHVLGTGFIQEPMAPNERFIRPMKFHALRGHLTKKRCEKMTGQELNDVLLGDPGLMMPFLFPKIKKKVQYDVGIILHQYDKKYDSLLKNFEFLHMKSILFDTKLPVEEFIEKVLSCEFIFSSALHGLVCADSFGIPCQHIVLGPNVGTYKFYDYYSVFPHHRYSPVNLQDRRITDEDVIKFGNAYNVWPNEIEFIRERYLDMFKHLADYLV